MSDPLRVAVVVCTHNRAELTVAAVDSVCAQTVPDGAAVEIVVVDNASTDGTAAAVDRLADRRETPVRVVHEPTLGLSHARNAGIRVVADTADVIAFLDDDALAEPGWLDGLVRVFGRGVQVGFGPVDAIWGSEKPDWLTPDVESYFTVLDLGDEPHEVDADDQWFAGANIAFRAEALRDAGGFPTHLGRVGSLLLSNEEREVVRRIAAAGGTVGYEPTMRVRHHVHPDRISRRWLLRRGYWQGVSDEIARQDLDPDGVVDAVRLPPIVIDALIALGLVTWQVRRTVQSRGRPDLSSRQRVNHAIRVGMTVARRRLRRLA